MEIPVTNRYADLLHANIELQLSLESRIASLKAELRRCDELRQKLLLASQRQRDQREDWSVPRRRFLCASGQRRDPFAAADDYPDNVDAQRRAEIEYCFPLPTTSLLHWSPTCREHLAAHVAAAFSTGGEPVGESSWKWDLIANAINVTPNLPPSQKRRSAMGCLLYYLNGFKDVQPFSDVEDKELISALYQPQMFRKIWERKFSDRRTLIECAMHLRALTRVRVPDVFSKELKAVKDEADVEAREAAAVAEELMHKTGAGVLIPNLKKLLRHSNGHRGDTPFLPLTRDQRLLLFVALILHKKYTPSRLHMDCRAICDLVMLSVVVPSGSSIELRETMIERVSASGELDRMFRLASVCCALCTVPKHIATSVSKFIEDVRSALADGQRNGRSWHAVASDIFGMPLLKDAVEAAYVLSFGKLRLDADSDVDGSILFYPVQHQRLGTLLA